MKKIFFLLFLCACALASWADCTVYYAGTYTNVKAYAWDASGSNANWPGQAMTQTAYTFNGKPVWTITLSKDYPNIIFNQNGNPQTADLLNNCGMLYDHVCDRWVAYAGTGDATDNGCVPDPQGVVGVPAEYEGVMLQGFYWDSNRLTKYGRTVWKFWIDNHYASQAGRVFDLVWMPPSGKGGGTGYYTQTYSDQSSDWGIKTRLQEVIDTLHAYGTKVLADIVVNHRASSNGWAQGFTREVFGADVFQITSQHICSTDEARTSSDSDSKNLQYGNPDTGDNDGGCRDLDHTNEYVQTYIKRYLQWMQEEMGFDGWRYDMVKGYNGKYVSMYNISSQPFFSVGEYYDGDVNKLKNYLASASYNTTVFDFALKFKLNSTIGKGNFSGLANAGMRGQGLQKYAVTFIDNHDTFERSDAQGNEFIGYNVDLTTSTNRTRILQANAYLLMLPGTPCVCWPHWYTFPDEISTMVAIRHSAGIHSESPVSDEAASTNAYTATITGHRGRVVLRMGSGRNMTCPNGFMKVFEGPEMEIYSTVPTDLETLETAQPQAHKEFRDGQLIIRRGDKAYDIYGRIITSL